MSAKDKALIEKQRALEAAEEAQRLAEEERLKYIEETKAAVAQENQEVLEQAMRLEQLVESKYSIKTFKRHARSMRIAQIRKDEWERYLKCDDLPNPSIAAEMNTYLHLWDKIINKTTLQEAVIRTDEVVKLLNDLDRFIDDPHDYKKMSAWKWVRSIFRGNQQRSLDVSSYDLLSDIYKKLKRLDISTAEYRLKEKNMALCLWAKIQLPISTPNPRTPQRPRLELSFPEMDMKILFPHSVHHKDMALRAMYVSYDHLSDTCFTFEAPNTPVEYLKDIYDIVVTEWYRKMKYKYDLRVIPPKSEPIELINEDGSITYLDPEPEILLQEGDLPPQVPYQKLVPTPNDYAISIEDEILSGALQSLKLRHPSDVVNMRKYMVIGGVYYLNLFYQPSQPQEYVLFGMHYKALLEPGSLSDVPYHVQYTPPPQPEAGVRRLPEEIEEEIKLQEAEYDKLMLITITLPLHVLWLDVPIVCHWDVVTKEWKNTDIHDLKHIEEKGFITFRSGKFGPFAIATLKYTNLPFQAWDLRPEIDGSVTLQLTCAILMMEFNVKDNLISMSQLQNSPGEALDKYVGIYYTLPVLKRVMRNCGVDVFPAMDTFHYVEGSCEKHWPMERHLYYQISQAATLFHFTWSRWNISAGRRAIVLQTREHYFNKPKQKNYSMLLVTPVKALFVNCTEVSQVFVKKGIDGMKFYADLNHLVKGTSSKATRTTLNQASKVVTNALAELLIATRMLSYS